MVFTGSIDCMETVFQVVSSCNLYYDYVILCHCTLAAALYFEQSSCDELMEFKQIQTRAQPEESLKHNHSCTTQTCHLGHGHCFFTPMTGLCNYGYVLMIPRAAPSFESV